MAGKARVMTEKSKAGAPVGAGSDEVLTSSVSVITADLHPGETIQYSANEHIFALAPDRPTVTPGSEHGQKLRDVEWGPNSVGYLAPTVAMTAVILEPSQATFIAVPDQIMRTAAFETIDTSTVEPRWAPNINDPISADMIKLMAKVKETVDPSSWPMIQEAIATALAVRTMQNLGAKVRHEDAPYPRGLPEQKLRMVLEYIDEHYCEPIRLSELAGVAMLSAFHFSRAFKLSMNLAPIRYVWTRRIERAKMHLQNNKLSLATIAYACGFSSQAHFTTAFKQLTGMTPTAFRAALRTLVPPALVLALAQLSELAPAVA